MIGEFTPRKKVAPAFPYLATLKKGGTKVILVTGQGKNTGYLTGTVVVGGDGGFDNDKLGTYSEHWLYDSLEAAAPGSSVKITQ